MSYTTFFRCRQCFCKVVLAANYEPQATKSFLIQQFFKNVGEVWASSPHLRSKSNFQMKCNKNLRENRKESQLPFQSRGCNENTRFQGQLRFPGKLGMCPSLAEPDSSGFPKSSVSHETKQKLLLEKTVFRIRQKGVPPLLLPASVLQLPRCLVRICNLFHRNNQIANW